MLYTACCLVMQIVAPKLTGFQGLKKSKKFLSENTHNPIFYPANDCYLSNVIIIKWSGDHEEEYKTNNCI